MAYNWGEGASGALGGAGIGASLGGPYGAAAGGILGLLSGFLPQNKMDKISTMTPQQLQLLNNYIQQLGSGLGEADQGSIDYLQQLMNPNSEAVNQFAQPYINQFQQEIVPGLAERFAGLGAMGGGLSSSGFGQSLSTAAGNLQQNLAALKAGLGQQAAGQLMSTYGARTGQALAAQPFGYQQPQTGFGTGLLGGYAQAGFPGLFK